MGFWTKESSSPDSVAPSKHPCFFEAARDFSQTTPSNCLRLRFVALARRLDSVGSPHTAAQKTLAAARHRGSLNPAIKTVVVEIDIVYFHEVTIVQRVR